MSSRALTCIGCPLGCSITVEFSKRQIKDIRGNLCKNGYTYAENEIQNPIRILTTTVRVKNGIGPLVPVKTKEGIPKNSILDYMKSIRTLSVEAPIRAGEIVAVNYLGMGVDIVAVKDIEAREDKRVST